MQRRNKETDGRTEREQAGDRGGVASNGKEQSPFL